MAGENENPDGSNPPASSGGNVQTDDFKAKYIDLSAKIANGEYVEKKVYAGLQKTHQDTVLAHKADHDALVAANEELGNLKSTLTVLQGQMTELTTKATGFEQDLGTTKQDLERAKLIMKDFPGLVEFEGADLLPKLPMDKLPDALKAFQEKIGSVKQASKEDYASGRTDPPGGKDPLVSATAATLLNEARSAQAAGKFAEYNQKMDAYHAALKNEAVK